jgi:inhibitor of KinA sporulation pathway (predicted exonuclease)
LWYTTYINLTKYGYYPVSYLTIMESVVSFDKYRFFIILDLKCTTVANVQEIVDFGAILFDIETRRTRKQFYRYVKPLLLTKLSGKTESFLDIKWSDCEDAYCLSKVLEDFHCKFREELPQSLIITVGDVDLARFIPGYFIMHKALGNDYPLPEVMQYFNKWCNLKKIHTENTSLVFGNGAYYGSDVNQMLNYHGFKRRKIERTIDDVKATATIIEFMLRKKYSFYATSFIEDFETDYSRKDY